MNHKTLIGEDLLPVGKVTVPSTYAMISKGDCSRTGGEKRKR